MKIRFIILILFCFPQFTFSQELICKISVNAQKISSFDQKIFQTLQASLNEFMNTQKWTNEIFAPNEKIECSFFLTLEKGNASTNSFSGQLSIAATRPVFNSSYSTSLFRHIDNEIIFEYQENQVLAFQENVNMSNLTSIFAFYAYVILGLDYNTFALNGGTPLFMKAQGIVNATQSSQIAGWQQSSNQINSIGNRYTIISNLLDPRLTKYHDALYRYHIKGLDKMFENQIEARKAINESMDLLVATNNELPKSMIMQLFFNAKSDEIANLYANATPPEKSKVMQQLAILDGANINKYQKSMKP